MDCVFARDNCVFVRCGFWIAYSHGLACGLRIRKGMTACLSVVVPAVLLCEYASKYLMLINSILMLLEDLIRYIFFSL